MEGISGKRVNRSLMSMSTYRKLSPAAALILSASFVTSLVSSTTLVNLFITYFYVVKDINCIRTVYGKIVVFEEVKFLHMPNLHFINI
jgi:hypothetical protein